MVQKEQCPSCKGNKFIRVTTTDGREKNTPCPHCGGNGYRVRITLHAR
jgi:DnaJ-class molecular chaperone